MNDLILFLTNGSETFTPEVLCRVIVFVIIFDGLMMLLGGIAKGAKR